MSKLIHPLGTIGGTISPFIDNKYNTTEPSANISFLVSEVIFGLLAFFSKKSCNFAE